MREHSITVNEAKDLCRQNIKEHVANFLRIVKENQHNMDLSEDLRKLTECVQYTLSGHVVWSIQCPRYHSAVSFNELQLARIKYGVKDYPAKSYELNEKWDTQLTHNSGISSSLVAEVIKVDLSSTNSSD